MIESIHLAITAIFLISVLSYYFLLLLPRHAPPPVEQFRSITVIIPAHNEAQTITETVLSVQKASYAGIKRIIVVDDGSTDGTGDRARCIHGITVLRTEHLGKAAAINHARSRSRSALIAIVDADSTIEPGALSAMASEVGRPGYGAACGVVTVKNSGSVVGMWLHIEQLYNSLMRLALSKINANIVTPGPLSMYRADALRVVDGFSTRGYSEDVDVTIRLIRAGYRIGFSEKSVAKTIMPTDPRGFLRQRARFARGTLTIFKFHLKLSSHIIDAYTLPLLAFGYLQAILLGTLLTYTIINGYITYFFSKGIIVSFAVVRFFFEWFSLAGTVNWILSITTGIAPLTALAILSITATLLSYPLFIYAIVRFEKKITLMLLIAFFFMPLYWMITMFVYVALIPAAFGPPPPNKWTKNEFKG